MPTFNPFKPGQIVSPGMFSGRIDELLRIEKALYQTKNGNAAHFLIRGERGIGKSSLMFYVDSLAGGHLESIGESLSFKFLTIQIELEPGTTYSSLIDRVSSKLAREIAERKPAVELAKAGWEFLKKLEVMGVKYNDNPNSIKPNDMLDDLVSSLEKTIKSFGSELDGIVILIDEADKAPASANLGEFVKLLTERLTKKGCNQVCIGISGLPTVLQKMKESHESSIRIFDVMTLEPLLPEERKHVLHRGLAAAKEKNGFEVVMTEEAENAISELSEGYPHFIQQFAYCAFDKDADNTIDIKDVQEGALDPENGAIEQLGLSYFHDLYFDQIGSDEYRQVLIAMAETLDGWVKKTDLRKRVTIKETTLSNAISALKTKRIILPKPGVAGVYKLPTRSFAVWIKARERASESDTEQGEATTKPAGTSH